MSVFMELKNRGLIAQCTNEEKVRRLLEKESTTFYIGFDPTADSLHVGHFLQMVIMAHLQKAGHRPIALIGGGTAMVGDPSGRTDMREMMTPERIRYNANRFQAQLSRIVDFSEGKARMVNNADWLLDLNYISFLREIGTHFSVNRMLSAECFKSRLEKGLSFIEFNYMLMQGYDFYKLHKDYGCKLQLGGDDQWSNIIGGIELIRRIDAEEAYGLTFALLTTADGNKMGKTMKGAVWLDPEKTPPYEFYQYWRNVEDANVIKCLKFLTFLPLSEIETYAALKDSEINRAKEVLAYEVTKMVHGRQAADQAQEAAKALFSAGSMSDHMPTTILSDADFTDEAIGILDLICKTGLAKSKGEARRLVEQGGIAVNDQKVTLPSQTVTLVEFKGEGAVLRKGKKVFHRIRL